MGYLFTSESVTSGHPDKLCDYISDSILDACISIDKEARVAVEVFVKGLENLNSKEMKSHIIIGGEVTLNSEIEIDFEKIARECAINVGYIGMDIGMDATSHSNCEVKVLINRQSDEISRGVKNSKEEEHLGAGDQGIIFGYANSESEYFSITKGSYMPLPILLAHKITLEITKKRENGDLYWARPDGKSQVTVEYDDKDKPIRIDTIVVAIQHQDMLGDKFKNEKEERRFIQKEIEDKIIKEVIPEELIDDSLRIIVNGTGRFCKGGPYADAGLTGRKIIVDTYGGSGRHGGGAFSGKDPTKVDRSAAYAARWAAKNIVASGLCEVCEIQLAYSIGKANPVSINVNSYGTSKIGDLKLINIIEKNFDFRPSAIIDNLKLQEISYSVTSNGGHFGRMPENGNFPWEKIDNDLLERILK